MNSKAPATDTKEQAEQNFVANRTTQEQAELDPAFSAGTGKEWGYFLSWWSEYQKKMKSAFHAAPLKLQIQGEQ
jgi:hypothetical protein